jgi:glycosyltransferase involved in cell wall biosynthesis
MYSDMVNVFHENGHQVFPMAPINDEEQNSFISAEQGIDVLRVRTRDVFNKDLIQKGIANVLLPYQYKKAFNKFWKQHFFDLIIVATPSVMFANFVAFTKKKTKAKVLLLQKDIFPQNAVDLGYMRKGSLIYNFFKINEVKLLKVADIIGCTSEGNKKYLLEHYPFLQKRNLDIVYNSTKLLQKDSNKNLQIRSKYNILDKFVIVFGGNIGKPQQLENVLKLAQNASIYDDVLFLIIGKGTEVDAFKREAVSLKISNILFIDKIPREEYFILISNCNLGLISLHQDFTVPNTPMKLNDYLNAGIPVLASIDRGNDIGELLVSNNLGKFAFADSPTELFSAFKELYLNKEDCVLKGNNGIRFCEENLSAEKSYQRIINIIN